MQPSREQLVDILEPMVKQIIQQHPERRFAYTFLPGSFTIVITHDGLWCSASGNTNNITETMRTSHFQDIFNAEYGLALDIQELIHAAETQMREIP